MLKGDELMTILSWLPRSKLPAAQAVCKCWYSTVRSESFVSARRAEHKEAMVFAIGGQDNTGRSHGRMSMLVDGAWVQAAPLHEPASMHSAVACDEEVYVFGGNHCLLSSPGLFPVPSCACVKVFSPRTGQWRAILPMPSERSLMGACEANGKIYAFGGLDTEDGIQDVCTVEMYDPVKTQWWILDDMPYRLSSPRCVAVGSKIYVMGGYVLKDGDAHQTGVVQVFDTEGKNWHWRVMQSEMPISGAVPIASGTRIFFLGGFASGEREDGKINRIRTSDMGPPAVWWCPDSAYSVERGGEGKPFDPDAFHLPYGPYRELESVRLDENGEEAAQASDEDDDDFYDRTSDWPPENYPLAWPYDCLDAYTDESWCLDTHTGEWMPLQPAPKAHLGDMLYLDQGVIRDANDPELNYDIETDTWFTTPCRQPLSAVGHFSSGAQVAAPVVPF